jgi:hypothetical protein
MLTCLAKSSALKVEVRCSSETLAKLDLSEWRYIALSFFGKDTVLRWDDPPVFRRNLLFLSSKLIEESVAGPPFLWSRVTNHETVVYFSPFAALYHLLQWNSSGSGSKKPRLTAVGIRLC